MDFKDIQRIVDLMSEHGLTEFELEENGVRIAMKKGGGVTVAPVSAPAAPAAAPAAAPSAPAAPPAEDANMAIVKAPFVGTFYRASAPDADPFVVIGQEVGPDTVLCILEAMKVMNEIKAEMRGRIKEILVESAHPVQYGQSLFKIEKI